jgi:hypothetical protein
MAYVPKIGDSFRFTALLAALDPPLPDGRRYDPENDTYISPKVYKVWELKARIERAAHDAREKDRLRVIAKIRSKAKAEARAIARAKANLAKADRWLTYAQEQVALATQAKADAEAALNALGGAPTDADLTLTKLLDAL